MSVYRKRYENGKESPVYSYDFKLNGRRFSGVTEATSEREALRIEKLKKLEAAKEIEKTKRLKGKPWTVNDAMTSYFKEHLGGEADETTLTSFAWIQDRIGEVRLLDIDDSRIAELVAERAMDLTKNRRKPTRVSASTVNRTVVEPMRRVFRRSLLIHKQPHGDVTWSNHLKAEPQERIRELKADEETALFEALPADFHPIIHFHLATGVRLAESIGLTWRDVDFGNRIIMISGKGGTRLPIPMAPSVREILFAEQGHDPERVFTYVVKKNQFNPNTRKRYIAGERLPITYSGLKTAFRRNRIKAGIIDFRFHDQRHTAATRVLRQSNLKVVQTLLRHKDIATTTRYAHVTNDDVMAAMEKAVQATATQSTTEPTTEVVATGKSARKSKR
jgi:integrase